jgi:phosphoenolpyruvate carboxykinase (ATP)
MPNASVTEFGNVNVKARVDSRSTKSTYIVDDSTNSRGQTITRAEYDRVAALQDTHIADSHMVVVDGYIGSDPHFRTKYYSRVFTLSAWLLPHRSLFWAGSRRAM